MEIDPVAGLRVGTNTVADVGVETESVAGVAVGTDAIAGVKVGTDSVDGVRLGADSVAGVEVDGKKFDGTNIGAPVVGWFVGFLDGPIVQVGDDDVFVPSSITNVSSDGVWEPVSNSKGGEVVGLLVGILDGEKDHEGPEDASKTSLVELGESLRAPALGASEINL